MQNACAQCKARNRDWIWVQCNYENTKTEWKKVDMMMGDSEVPKALEQDVALLDSLEFPKHLTQLPSWVLMLYGLKRLDLSYCEHLETLPFEELLLFPFLTELNLVGCSQLWSPPRDICQQGGKATLKFLKEVKSCGEFNRSMTLFLIGDGETGKTSLVKALQSDTNRADYIRSDNRTKGIDITSWEPSGSEITFKLFDLAGQAVYLKTHQIFLLRRALYIFVWRVGPTNLALKSTVENWLESIQNRVPSSYLMLVVTHIDVVEPQVLDDQCRIVKDCVQHWERSFVSNRKGTVQALRIWGGGESMRVDCLSGKGVDLLRSELLSFSATMPWFKECLPRSWIDLQARLETSKKLKNFLGWDEYTQLAIESALTEDLLESATKFFHDTGVIRYFGESVSRSSQDVLLTTVYVSVPWMIDVMKGIICHDRQLMVDYALMKQDNVMLHHINRLTQCGWLHQALIPFLWPSPSNCPEFWTYLCEKGLQEKFLPKGSTGLNVVHQDRAMALLDGFDILTSKNDEFLVPGALMPAKFPTIPVLDVPECPFQVDFTYCAIPPGVFESIVVRMAKKFITSSQVTPFLATFFNDVGGICQCLSFKDDFGVACDVKEHLLFRASSQDFLDEAEKEVARMESFFTGMNRLDRIQVQSMHSLCPQLPIKLSWASDLRVESYDEISCPSCLVSHRAKAHMFNKKQYASLWIKIVTRPNEPWIDLDCPECKLKLSLKDLMTTVRISELRQCPCCQSFGLNEQASGSFSAGICRLHFKENGRNDIQTVTCFTCMQAGRLGQICISDLVPAELYIAGFWNLEKDQSVLVKDMLYSLEVNSGFGCYYTNKNDQKQELDVLKKSRIVLLLLSDRSFLSDELEKLLVFAFRSRQLLIPILLVSDSQQTHQRFWTGPVDKDYWQHASKLSVSTEGFDWSLLKHYCPVCFSFSKMQHKQSRLQFANDLVAIVNSHIQVIGKVDAYTEVSTVGVKLSFLDVFIDRNGGVGVFGDLTTEQVVKNFIKPATEQSKLSYVQLLMSEGAGHFVGTADWFYSHAWQFRFLDLVLAAKLFFEGKGQDPILWLDMFSISQHKSEGRSFEWWNIAFLSSIGSVGNVLMLMQPFEDPRTRTPAWTTLTRVWCVFELYASESTLGNFEVTMTKEMSQKFRASIQADTMSLVKALTSLDCAQSKASSIEDQTRVFEVISKTVGFPLLNTIVIRVVERWIYSALILDMADKDSEFVAHVLGTMDSIAKLFLRDCEKKLGANHGETVYARAVVDRVHRAQKDPVFCRELLSKGWTAFDLEEQKRSQEEMRMSVARRAEEIAVLEAEMMRLEAEEAGRREAADKAKEMRMSVARRAEEIAVLEAEMMRLEAEEAGRREAADKAKIEAEQQVAEAQVRSQCCTIV